MRTRASTLASAPRLSSLRVDRLGDDVLLRAYVDPPGFVPNWMARSTFRRELPQMLTQLRKRCEAEQTVRAQAAAPDGPPPKE